jgi:hypothetical protein
MNPTDAYEAPSLERVGTVDELTAASGLTNSDNHVTANNAFSNP